MTNALNRALDALPYTYAGPGGAAAVLREGRVAASNCWGWADAERRIPFTARTMFRICSITKQFTCSLLLDQVGEPEALDADVARALPSLSVTPPHARELCHNQSGLRDYWALTTVCGSPVEGAFDETQARALIQRTASLQFDPGTRSSYCNQNFRLLGDIVATRAGRDFGELLRERIFDRARMPHAVLGADTSVIAGDTLGYEGSPETGFRPAVNRIVWTGDAGITASLDDMIAWETFIDATRDDPDGLYRRLSTAPTFRDGTPAQYGFGLSHGVMRGRRFTGHGGGLRGWRSYRLHAPDQRLSVVVLFNHMADARDAAMDLFLAALDEPAEPVPDAKVDPTWTGNYQEPETGLAVRLEAAGSRVRVHYATTPELIDPATDVTLHATSLSRGPDGIWMDRPGEHQRSLLAPVEGEAARDIEGIFRSTEWESELSVVATGGVLYGAFAGFLGQGEMQALRPLGGDVWLLPCPRALDYHAPGDWTLAFRRDAARRIAGVQVGCWLARRVEYEAV